jgi:hypothetical protein
MPNDDYVEQVEDEVPSVNNNKLPDKPPIAPQPPTTQALVKQEDQPA